MPPSAVRKGLWGLAAGLAAIALIVAALPLAASTQIVRDRIAQEISVWSGYRVELAQAPDIEVWPSFRAILHNVTLSEHGGEGRPAVVEAERVEIDLSAMAALRGDVVFSNARFVRPVLRLVSEECGFYLPALPDTGRMVRAVEIGRAAVAQNPSRPEDAALPGNSFGTVEFSGGRIVIAEEGMEREVLTSAAGVASWPALNQAGSLTATGIWRGEALSLNISSPQPLMLFAGGNAALTVDLKSAPINASFAGSANFSEGFLDGGVSVSSPSVRRALEWASMHIAPGAAIGALTLDARVTGSGQRFSFQDTRLTLGGEPGRGVLDLALTDGAPGISGTLAFEKLDLQSFMSAFMVLPSPDGATSRIDTSFTDQANLDLRLSAATATAGAITLSDVAATAQVKGGLAVFDVSDATAFSGALQAGIRLDRRADGNHAEIRIRASDFDSAAFAAAVGAKRFVPQGRASVSVLLKGPATDWNSFMDTAEGAISATLANGSIVGVDLPAFLRRAAQGGFFSLGDLAEGSLAIAKAEFDAALSRGVARIDKAEAVTPQGVARIKGIVPYVGRGLALSGTVTPEAGGGETSSFFVGGLWSAPFVSPIVNEQW